MSRQFRPVVFLTLALCVSGVLCVIGYTLMLLLAWARWLWGGRG